MGANKLKLQSFRVNDLVNDKGKQIEFGKTWYDDFFGIPSTEDTVILNITFKALSDNHSKFNNTEIELKLSEITGRGDRKAYANGENGMSQLKDFFVHKLKLTQANIDDYFGFYKKSETNYYLFFIPKLLKDNFVQLFLGTIDEITIERKNKSDKQEYSTHQQIFYGAPGTGKSHKIKEIIEKQPKKNVFRTTFHPDSDYSTFVGCYKPTTNGIRQISGDNISVNKTISYEFVAQAFTNAYIRAYQIEEPVFLIIEEINRGNCAQIFGDLFQLLDRNEDGISEYSIKPDADLRKYLANEFKDLFCVTKKSVAIYKEVIKGEEMLLPSNLYIWATMNTSDQSLFPIDSAFKRRWDWKYTPISDGNKGWTIIVNEEYSTDWWGFIECINKDIEKATKSEDKKLGYYFCKTDNGIIDAETFVSKVVFYLWNDVFKDYGYNSSVFKTTDGKKISFHDFYNTNGSINTQIVQSFIEHITLEK